MVDARALLEGLQENMTLMELDLSNNQITDRKALGSALAAVLKVGHDTAEPERSIHRGPYSACAACTGVCSSL